MATVHAPFYVEVGAVWFTGLGFRPAIEIPPHRHDHVDPARLVPAPDADEPYSKFDLPVTLDAPAEGHGFGFVLWPAASPQITAASLAGPGVSTPSSTPWHPSTSSPPWWPSEPNEPEWPCCIVQEPEPPLPPVAPVPLPASSICLLVALAGLTLLRRKP